MISGGVGSLRCAPSLNAAGGALGSVESCSEMIAAQCNGAGSSRPGASIRPQVRRRLVTRSVVDDGNKIRERSSAPVNGPRPCIGSILVYSAGDNTRPAQPTGQQAGGVGGERGGSLRSPPSRLALRNGHQPGSRPSIVKSQAVRARHERLSDDQVIVGTSIPDPNRVTDKTRFGTSFGARKSRGKPHDQPPRFFFPKSARDREKVRTIARPIFKADRL